MLREHLVPPPGGTGGHWQPAPGATRLRVTFTGTRVDSAGPAGERCTVRLAQMLANTGHTLELSATGDVTIESLQAFQPPER